MAELKHTKEELKKLQSLPLEEKITLSRASIKEWYEHWQGNVCVSYSGGKDSTVLLRLVRELYPGVPAVYIDAGFDYPEVREHVKATENVIWLKPEMHFREVIEKYGYCFPSKEVANAIESMRHGATTYLNHFEGKNADGTKNEFRTRVFPRWKWLIDAPIKISAKCCAILKDKPFKKYQRETGTAPYVGLLATESLRRRYSWYLSGNNSFSTKKSKPLSIWTEQDILRYIVDNKVKIPSCYGDIIVDSKGRLHTTKEKRTGCVFCPIGAHLDKPNHFQRIKETHPALYRYCMKDLGLESFLSTLGIEH